MGGRVKSRLNSATSATKGTFPIFSLYAHTGERNGKTGVSCTCCTGPAHSKITPYLSFSLETLRNFRASRLSAPAQLERDEVGPNDVPKTYRKHGSATA